MHKAGWNVATPQRRDIGSTRIKVNKRQRHDISPSFCLSIIKSKGGPKFEGIEDRTNEGT